MSRRLPIRCVDHNNELGNSLGLLSQCRKRSTLSRDVHHAASVVGRRIFGELTPFTIAGFSPAPPPSARRAWASRWHKRIGAEIISLDSMAIYRGMDIGTAKPSREQRAAVPHHLIDIVDPADEFSVAQYVDAAAASR